MRIIIFASLLATSFAALREYGLPSLRGSNGGQLSSGHLKNGLVNGHFGAVNGQIGASHDVGRFNGQGLQSSDFGGQVQVSEVTGHQQANFGVPLPADHSFNGGLPAVDVRQDIPVEGTEQQGFDVVQEQVSGDFGIPADPTLCGEGQVLNSEGLCAEADVSKTIYLYTAPERVGRQRSEPAPTPKPKLNYNIVFVKAPEDSEEDQPIVIPPPQQKTIVYVLSKDGEERQEIIEVPAGPAHKPEVYYISYNEGENPDLSLGLNLESALASAVNEEGKIIEVEISDDISSGQFEFKDDSGLNGQVDLQTEGVAGLNGQSEFHAGESAGLNGQSGLQAGGYDGSPDSQVGGSGLGNGFAVHVNGASGLGNGLKAQTNGASGFGNGFETHSNGANGNGNGYQAQTGGNGFGNGFQAHSNGANGNGNVFQAHSNGASGNGNVFLAHSNGVSGNGNGLQAQTGGNGFVNGAPFEVRTSSESDSGEHSQDAGAQLSIHSQNGQSVLPQQPVHQRQQPSRLYNTPRGY